MPHAMPLHMNTTYPSHKFAVKVPGKKSCDDCGFGENDEVHSWAARRAQPETPHEFEACAGYFGCGICNYGPGAYVHNGEAIRKAREAALYPAMQEPEEKKVEEKKDGNPKDAVGGKKLSLSVLSFRVLAMMALGMMEGALKYGRHNYRIAGVRASVYLDATFRHLMSWWEGEDIDPASGVHHLAKAMSSLHVILDGILQGKWTDDRPPRNSEPLWMDKANAQAEELLNRYPNSVPPFTQAGLLVPVPEQVMTQEFPALQTEFPPAIINGQACRRYISIGHQFKFMELRAKKDLEGLDAVMHDAAKEDRVRSATTSTPVP